MQCFNPRGSYEPRRTFPMADHVISMFQSTRLVRAATSTFFPTDSSKKFQSTRLVRAATSLSRQRLNVMTNVSIHAARTSRDPYFSRHISVSASFNPRGSYEPRLARPLSAIHSIGFQPRGSYEPRPQSLRANRLAGCFNPRGSYEPRQSNRNLFESVEMFQSTRLVRSRDLAGWALAPAKPGFISTRLVRAATGNRS